MQMKYDQIYSRNSNLLAMNTIEQPLMQFAYLKSVQMQFAHLKSVQMQFARFKSVQILDTRHLATELVTKLRNKSPDYICTKYGFCEIVYKKTISITAYLSSNNQIRTRITLLSLCVTNSPN